MSWDWEQGSTGGQWTLSVGAWRAVVQRIASARPRWQGTLEHTTEPHKHHTSPPYTDAMDARSWCLRTIAKLASKAV